MSEDAFEAGARKLLEFMAAHPELADQLGLFMADASTLESVDPDAYEILWREMPEFAG